MNSQPVPLAPEPSYWGLVMTEGRRLLASRPFQLFLCLWVLSAGYLTTTPARHFLAPGIALALLLLVHWLLTLRFLPAAAPHAVEHETRSSRLRLWLQLSAVLLITLLTVPRSLEFHGLIPTLHIPGWSPMLTALHTWARGVVPNPNYIVNPFLYVVLPLAFLLLLGARPRELGLTRGRHRFRSIGVWGFEFLIAIALSLLLRRVSLLYLGRVLLSNSLQNGFMEEFLWRGAIQTRLTQLAGSGWGLALASLGFGIWHIGLNTNMAGGDWMAGVALAVVLQGVAGLGFGYHFRRTGSLIGPSVVHVLANSASW